VDLFVSPSGFLKTRYEEWGIEPERIIHCENGRPIWEVEERRHRRRQDLFVVSFFGQIVFHKGLDVFLKAALEYSRLRERSMSSANSDLPEVRFAIHGKMGNPPQELKEEIERLLEEAHSVVDHHGPYHPAHTKEKISSADVVVVPSIWWENSPMVIQEAFMAKKPVICSNIGGCAEHVDDGVNGLHFVVGDPFDLLSKILDLAGNPELYDTLVAGIPTVMSDREMFEILDRHYRDIMDRPSRIRISGAQERAVAVPSETTSESASVSTRSERETDGR
jgi:glycosyltransferase involved in cell wall biosynthesis